jgi:hypothetical protein
MKIPPEVEAAMITVAGEWAKYLYNFKPNARKAVFDKLLTRYEAIYESLEVIHKTHFQT